MAFSAELKCVGRNALIGSLLGLTFELTSNKKIKAFGLIGLSEIVAEVAQVGLAKMTIALAAGAMAAAPLYLGTNTQKTEQAMAYLGGSLVFSALVLTKKNVLGVNTFLPGEVFAAFVTGALVGGFVQRKYKLLKDR
ncbi:MAG: hypothetical protein H0X29_05275 [Parachlamydiaceae bacterium]|nr:hypothetical protein [Parachlamydiaceae bacterium]